MITHEMDVVKQICNRVVVMNKGVVVEEGDVLEVFRDPKNEVTQAMLGTALAARTIPASMVERVKKVLNTPGENGRKNHLIRLTFVGSSTTEPVLSRACSKFDLDFNILLGQVDEIQSESYGTLTIVMEGTTENFRQALNYIAERGVRVEELTKSSNIINLLWESFLETILMVGVSGGLGAAIGIPLGVFLFVTSPKGIMPKPVRQPHHRHCCECRAFDAVHHSVGCHHSVYALNRRLFHRYRCCHRSPDDCRCSAHRSSGRNQSA